MVLVKDLLKNKDYFYYVEDTMVKVKYIGYRFCIKYPDLFDEFRKECFSETDIKLLNCGDDDYLVEFEKVIKDQIFYVDEEKEEDIKIYRNINKLKCNKTYMFYDSMDLYIANLSESNINTRIFNLPEPMTTDTVNTITIKELKNKYYIPYIKIIDDNFNTGTQIHDYEQVADLVTSYGFKYGELTTRDKNARVEFINYTVEKIEYFYNLCKKLPILETDIYLFRKNVASDYSRILKKNEIVEYYPMPFSATSNIDFMLNWLGDCECCHYIIKIPAGKKVLFQKMYENSIEATIFPGKIIFNEIMKITHNNIEKIIILCDYIEYTQLQALSILNLYKEENPLNKNRLNDDYEKICLSNPLLKTEYEKKYLKYKNKYLKLKNNLH